jgi:hypothetical protein
MLDKGSRPVGSLENLIWKEQRRKDLSQRQFTDHMNIEGLPINFIHCFKQQVETAKGLNCACTHVRKQQR